jgi:outer membrane protein assembly factor BamE
MSFPDERSARGWRTWLFAASVGAVVSLGACSAIDSPTARMLDAVTPSRPEIIQGNFISAEQVEAVRPGMSRVQVRDILGTPLVSSAFHADRWDYVFTMKRKGVEAQQFKLTAFFNGDVLDRIEGDDMPSEDEFVKRIGEQKKTPKVPPLEAKPEQLQKFRESNPAKAGDAASDDEDLPSSSAPQDYPPLEPAR